MEEKEWVRCGRCDGEIYEGTEYYQINGECVCESAWRSLQDTGLRPFG